MVAAVRSPADLANNALTRMGYKLRIGTLFDGSDAANKILDVYAQTRDGLLRDGEWGFSERNMPLVLLKQAPIGGYIPPRVWTPATDPPVPWLFEYAYPDDCLKVRAVKRTPLLIPNFDPQPTLFQIANDNDFAPARRVILSNVPLGLMVYTGQITDPATWDVGFVNAFAATLARVCATALVGVEGTKMESADESTQVPRAMAEMG